MLSDSKIHVKPLFKVFLYVNIPTTSFVRSSLNWAFAVSKSKSDSNCSVVAFELFTISCPLARFLDLRLPACEHQEKESKNYCRHVLQRERMYVVLRQHLVFVFGCHYFGLDSLMHSAEMMLDLNVRKSELRTASIGLRARQRNTVCEMLSLSSLVTGWQIFFLKLGTVSASTLDWVNRLPALWPGWGLPPFLSGTGQRHSLDCLLHHGCSSNWKA